MHCASDPHADLADDERADELQGTAPAPARACERGARARTRAQQGLVCLIVVNYGLTYAIISEKLFAILVFMVLVTTMQAYPVAPCVRCQLAR